VAESAQRRFHGVPHFAQTQPQRLHPTLRRTVGGRLLPGHSGCRRHRHPGAYLAAVAHQQRHGADLQANEAAPDQSSGWLVLGDQDWVLGPGEIAAFDTTVTDWFGSIGRFAARTWFASDGESNVQDATSLTVWGGAKVEHTSDLNRPQRA
jgi:hypothetical protein